MHIFVSEEEEAHMGETGAFRLSLVCTQTFELEMKYLVVPTERTTFLHLCSSALGLQVRVLRSTTVLLWESYFLT